PVDGRIVIRRGSCSCAPERPIPAVGHKIIDERIERGIIPLAARPWQGVGLGDVVPSFNPGLERVLAPDIAYVVDQLIDVLNVSLRSKTVGKIGRASCREGE